MAYLGRECDFASLDPDEQTLFDSIRTAGSLSRLADRLDTTDEHDAYFRAKETWFELAGRLLADWEPTTELPGDRITVDDQSFHVHGITHADTEPERALLRRQVGQLLDSQATVYCEQGIRRMYFDDMPDVYETDDYTWAATRCRKQGLDSHVEVIGDRDRDTGTASTFDGFVEDVRTVAARFRRNAFSLIDSGRELYGDSFASALGDVASNFLMSHEEFATGEDFASFRKSRQAAQDPALLVDLQRYYKRVFLPQPLEREWLRRHDPELEIFTHARNQRMADFAVYDSTTDSTPVHLIVGAAHQPGVCYYLDAHRTGDRTTGSFEALGTDRVQNDT